MTENEVRALFAREGVWTHGTAVDWYVNNVHDREYDSGLWLVRSPDRGVDIFYTWQTATDRREIARQIVRDRSWAALDTLPVGTWYEVAIK